MTNSIIYKGKGILAGATVCPKPIGSFTSAWERTDKLNPGLYAFPSGSKFVTYEVTEGEGQANAARDARAAKRATTAPVKAAKTPAKVLQLANAFVSLSASDKATLVGILQGK